ncbi:hypothetical protein Tco_0899258 [Tanacetum coccineum]
MDWMVVKWKLVAEEMVMAVTWLHGVVVLESVAMHDEDVGVVGVVMCERGWSGVAIGRVGGWGEDDDDGGYRRRCGGGGARIPDLDSRPARLIKAYDTLR